MYDDTEFIYFFYLCSLKTSKMNNRIEYIDIVKGIGMILVVCSHTDALGRMLLFMRMFCNSISLYFVIAVIGSFIVLYCSKFLQGSLIGIILMTLGKHSMTILCVEIAFIVWTKDVLRWMFTNSEYNEVAGVFEIIVTLMGGYLLSVLLHKSKLLSRVAYGS